MQWIGWLGVLRMVHTGYTLGVALGVQSKHSVVSFRWVGKSRWAGVDGRE